jgi:hypothetical protein
MNAESSDHAFSDKCLFFVRKLPELVLNPIGRCVEKSRGRNFLQLYEELVYREREQAQ